MTDDAPSLLLESVDQIAASRGLNLQHGPFPHELAELVEQWHGRPGETFALEYRES